jgi:hypothetical protein
MKFIGLFCLLVTTLAVSGQRNCGSQVYAENTKLHYPSLRGRSGVVQLPPEQLQALSDALGVIKIPVVVHVVYKTPEQNIPEQQIRDQIQSLNDDFAGTNADAANVPAAFRQLAAGNCQVQFILDRIIRKPTQVDRFFCDIYDHSGNSFTYTDAREPVKFSTKGGDDALPCGQYLNIWVASITDGTSQQLLGYSSLPGAVCNFDGVVINYKNFGFVNCIPHFDKGRTLTHEVGHYMGLFHIWGDQPCGNDSVGDTPTQKDSNAGCPLFQHVSSACANAPDGDLFMDYMDYVNDECMHMFTAGQKIRMRASFALRGFNPTPFFALKNDVPRTFAMMGQSISVTAPAIQHYFESHDGPNDLFNFMEIGWDYAGSVDGYTVKLRDLATEKKLTYTSKVNTIRLRGLQPGALYELVIVPNEKMRTPPESAPFLFVVSGRRSETPVLMDAF